MIQKSIQAVTSFRNVKILILQSAACVLFFYSSAFSFNIPELLKYDLIWTGVKAGEATLDIRESSEGIIITSTAKSAKWLSVFYLVDDKVESELSKNTSKQFIIQPLHYKINTREGTHRKNREVIFDYDRLKAVYIDHLSREKKEFEIPSQVFDALSSFYYLRTLTLEVNKSVYAAVFDSKKVWDVEIKILGKEKVRVPAGEFNTIKVKPLLKSEGIFNRKGEVYIWLTDDAMRIPVKMKTKVGVGSITASLVGGSY